MRKLFLIAALWCLATPYLAHGEPVVLREAVLPCHRLPMNVLPLWHQVNLKFDSLASDAYEGQVHIGLEFNPTKSRSSMCGLIGSGDGGCSDSFELARGLEGTDCDVTGKPDQIVLHADESLDIQEVSVSSEGRFGSRKQDNYKSRKIVEVLRDRPKQMIMIKLEKSIKFKGYGMVSMSFRGKMSKNQQGIFVSTQKEAYGDPYRYIVAQFQPTGARVAFPCFDEPRFRIPFHLKLTYPDNLIAYGNMDAKTTERDDQANMVTTKFEPTPEMPIHMAAFVVGQFDKPLEIDLQTRVHGLQRIKTRVITTPGRRDSAKFAFEVAQKALIWFDAYLDSAYPLNKFDLIALTGLERDNSESWGLTFVRDHLIWIDDETKPEAQITTAVNVAHVVAHQWFGNLISVAWWSDLWITEGFAAQLAFKFVEDRYVIFEIDSVLRLTALTAVMEADQSGRAHSLSPSRLETSSQIGNIFDQLEFMKSASLAQMVNEASSGWYQVMLRRLIAKHAHKTITMDDYADLMQVGIASAHIQNIQSCVKMNEVRAATIGEKSCDRFTASALVKMVKTFAKFQGVPLVSIDINDQHIGRSTLDSFHDVLKSNGLAVGEGEKQGLVLYTDRQFANVDKSRWKVRKPVMMSSLSDWLNTDFYISPIWLEEGDGMNNYVKYSIRPSFATYFRTRYSDDLYRRLIQAIKANALDPMSRLQLLDDATSLVEAKLISTEIFISLVAAYADETNDAVMVGLLTASKTLANLAGSEQAVATIQQTLIQYYERRKRFAFNGFEELIEQRARRVIATELIKRGNQQVIEDALKAYDEAANGGVQLFLREPAYTAIVVSGSDRVNELLDKLTTTHSYDERTRLSTALSLSSDKAVLAKLHSLTR